MSKNYNEINAKDNMKINKEVDESQVEQPKKPMGTIVGSKPKKVKRNLASRLLSGVLGPDGLPGIGSYVNDEIIIPAIKNIIFETITSAASMAMFGEKRNPNMYRGSGPRRPGEQYKPNTDYGNNYKPSGANYDPRPQPRIRYGVDEFIIDDRFDATHVITSLTENADMYGSTSVADYYDLIGVEGKHTDNSYGWTLETINDAVIVPVRGGGYVIKFPPVEVI